MFVDRIDSGKLTSASAEFCGTLRLVLACGNYNYLKDGAVFALNKLVQHLETSLGVKTSIFNPFARIVLPESFQSEVGPSASAYSVAVGLSVP